MLKKVISGGQTGADIAGLVVGKKFGLATGGLMPKGYKTQAGPKPQYKELYGVQEHTSMSYVPRTLSNAKESDGTMRLAFDFTTAGEKLTLKGIEQYSKPHFDVDLHNPPDPQLAADWILENKIETLNIAGNSERTFLGTGIAVQEYLTKVFQLLGLQEA